MQYDGIVWTRRMVIVAMSIESVSDKHRSLMSKALKPVCEA